MNQSRLVDSHIHLTDFEEGSNIGALIERAVSVGVSRLVCNGTSEKDWPEVLAVALAHPCVVPCFGLHPWFVPDRSEMWLDVLEGFIRDNCCGIGETGLDRLVDHVDPAVQEEAFRAQLELARRHDRPITVHCVRAWGWLMDVLRSEAPLPRGMLVHAYGGSVDLIKPLADMGAYFSFSGKALDLNYERARKALAAVPPDRLLVETDAPNMLPPEPFRTETVLTSDEREHNSPVNLPAIARGIAELLGESPDALTERLWENASRLFGSILDSR